MPHNPPWSYCAPWDTHSCPTDPLWSLGPLEVPNNSADPQKCPIAPWKLSRSPWDPYDCPTVLGTPLSTPESPPRAPVAFGTPPELP